MQLIYLDESGTGNPAFEPNVVIAGVMVDADLQWRALERYLKDMADDFALAEDREGFVFHAVELVNGGKRVCREKYPRKKRDHFLQALCEVPRVFQLPVLCFHVPRQRIRDRSPGLREDEIVSNAILQASMSCVQGAEQLMRKRPIEKEVAMVIYEDNGKTNKSVRTLHNAFRSALWSDHLEKRHLTNLVPFDRVIETAHFAEKTDASVLQVADVCAYVLGRLLRGTDQPSTWTRPLLDQLVFGHKELLAMKTSGGNDSER
jgi:Protein of unknown function (DUF3800)